MKLFVRYATHYASFRKIWSTSDCTALNSLECLAQEKGCRLVHAANMVRALSQGLRSGFKGTLESVAGKVEKIEKTNAGWNVSIDGHGISYLAETIIMATGSRPREFIPNGADSTINIPLDDVLRCSTELHSLFGPKDTVAVVGSSHSAMLVLKDIAEMDQKPARIINFYRSPLKFAEYLPDDRIKHDNTGLKGEVADWVRANIQDCGPAEEFSVQLDGILVRYDLAQGDEEEIYRKIFPQCTKIVSAVGYDRDPLPEITVNGHLLKSISYDDYGRLINGDEPIPNLFGLGIAFPARVIDVDGSPEQAVGLWKFIKHTDFVIDHFIQ